MVKNNSGESSVVVSIVIVLLVLVVGVSYWMFVGPPSPNSLESSNSSEISNELSQSSPRDLYLKYRQEFEATKSFNEMKDVIFRYGTSELIASVKSKDSELDPTDQATRAQVFQMTMAFLTPISEFSSVDESIEGSTATLNISVSSSDETGLVTLINEGGRWRLSREEWSVSR